MHYNHHVAIKSMSHAYTIITTLPSSPHHVSHTQLTQSVTYYTAGSEVCVQLHSLEGRLLSEAERRQPIWFGDVVVGARQQRVVRLHNSTPLPLPFCWQQTDEPVAEGMQRSCVILYSIMLSGEHVHV